MEAGIQEKEPVQGQTRMKTNPERMKMEPRLIKQTVLKINRNPLMMKTAEIAKRRRARTGLVKADRQKRAVSKRMKESGFRFMTQAGLLLQRKTRWSKYSRKVPGGGAIRSHQSAGIKTLTLRW